MFPVDVDTLFTLCFTNSKFMKEFREKQKTFGELYSVVKCTR